MRGVRIRPLVEVRLEIGLSIRGYRCAGSSLSELLLRRYASPNEGCLAIEPVPGFDEDGKVIEYSKALA